MSKTLSNILTVFKVARILAKVVFILCAVGCVGCLLGLIIIPMTDLLVSLITFFKAEFNFEVSYLECLVGFTACAGEAAIAFFAERYFKKVLDAKTPFTHEGSKEAFRLGVASVIISIAVVCASSIIVAIAELFSSSSITEYNLELSILPGLFLMFLSMLFKHGAELRDTTASKPEQEENTSNSETV